MASLGLDPAYSLHPYFSQQSPFAESILKKHYSLGNPFIRMQKLNGSHYLMAIFRPAGLMFGVLGTVSVRIPFLNFASTASSFESSGNERTR
jgi:hypothetical protein